MSTINYYLTAVSSGVSFDLTSSGFATVQQIRTSGYELHTDILNSGYLKRSDLIGSGYVESINSLKNNPTIIGSGSVGVWTDNNRIILSAMPTMASYSHKDLSAGIGGYKIAGQIAAQQMSSSSVTLNVLRAVPLIYPSSVHITDLSVYTSQNISGSGDIGIYNNISDDCLYPSGLLASTLPFDMATSGTKGGAISLILQGGKIYWAAFRSDSTRNMTTCTSVSMFPIFGTTIDFVVNPGVGIFVASAYDITLPNPFPAGGSILTGNTPAIRVKSV